MKINDLGILEYYTSSQGIGGKIKVFPEDFVVQEITPRGKVCSVNYSFIDNFKDSVFKFRKGKKYVRATLVKKNYSTRKCVSKLESVLKTRVFYAGMKDKKAVTAQRVSFKSESFRQVKEKDFFLKNFDYNYNKIGVGNLKGNVFRITVRDSSGSVQNFLSELIKNRMMLPNFFGPQRFGMHENTHLIGLHLVKRDYVKAIDEILKAKSFFEKRLEKNLTKGSLQALKSLGNRNLTFYFHALQSYLFNNSLSKMIVSKKREKKLFLPGYGFEASSLVKNEMSKLGLKSLENKELGVRVKGYGRKCFMRVNDFRVVKEKPLKLEFRLDKGCFASIILNELCK